MASVEESLRAAPAWPPPAWPLPQQAPASSPVSPRTRRGLRPTHSAARQIPAFNLESEPTLALQPQPQRVRSQPRREPLPQLHPPPPPPLPAGLPPVPRTSSRRSAVSASSDVGSSAPPRVRRPRGEHSSGSSVETEQQRAARRAARRAERQRALSASQLTAPPPLASVGVGNMDAAEAALPRAGGSARRHAVPPRSAVSASAAAPARTASATRAAPAPLLLPPQQQQSAQESLPPVHESSVLRSLTKRLTLECYSSAATRAAEREAAEKAEEERRAAAEMARSAVLRGAWRRAGARNRAVAAEWGADARRSPILRTRVHVRAANSETRAAKQAELAARRRAAQMTQAEIERAQRDAAQSVRGPRQVAAPPVARGR
jgi:hypothetical protein